MSAPGRPRAGLRAGLAQPSIVQGLQVQACGSSFNISLPDRLSLGVRLSYRLGVGGGGRGEGGRGRGVLMTIS